MSADHSTSPAPPPTLTGGQPGQLAMPPTPPVTVACSVQAAIASVTPSSVPQVPISRLQYNFTAVGTLGAMQLAAGVASTALMVGAVVAETELFYVAHGFWCALPFVLAGVFGLLLGVKRQYLNYLIMSYLATSCLAAVFALILVSLVIFCIVEAPRGIMFSNASPKTELVWRMLLHCLLLGVGLAELCFSGMSIYICGRYAASTYHESVQQPYGVLENVQQEARNGRSRSRGDPPGLVLLKMPPTSTADIQYNADCTLPPPSVSDAPI